MQNLANKTNFEKVKLWMQQVGQKTPQTFTPLTPFVKDLRDRLNNEEGCELSEELNKEHPDWSKVVKEACDNLVVVYGLLAAMGVDGDEAFAIVQNENDQKVAHRLMREDGKVVVPQEVKADLKETTSLLLNALLLQSSLEAQPMAERESLHE